MIIEASVADLEGYRDGFVQASGEHAVLPAVVFETWLVMHPLLSLRSLARALSLQCCCVLAQACMSLDRIGGAAGGGERAAAGGSRQGRLAEEAVAEW